MKNFGGAYRVDKNSVSFHHKFQSLSGDIRNGSSAISSVVITFHFVKCYRKDDHHQQCHCGIVFLLPKLFLDK